ncbi:GCN5 family acetyltransferase [Micractinium conductrix]|uniref:GCN5 family acetyltransferase n=1 Tax=Micractinium conductrix TaxID=554055 RepID=A0A2P6VQC4_9CHLO|nr:GCN5 family acetyltransferase [Micractinium conductrix]|eukprot:PSC76265.1 GCN5 family acetyltransferase [Micractinium conductrix]
MPPPAVGLLLLLSLAHLALSETSCSFPGFQSADFAARLAAVNSTGRPDGAAGRLSLTCGAEQLSTELTLGWAFDSQANVNWLWLGLQAPLQGDGWAALAFPQQTPQLAGATALVMRLDAAAASTGGVAYTEWQVPDGSWAGPLAPSAAYNWSVVAGGTAPGSGSGVAPHFGVVEVSQLQVPSFGTHWPIRFVPLLFAYGNSSSSSDAGGAPSGGLSLGQPLIAGSFNLSLSDNSAQDVVFWNVTSTASPAYTIWLGHVPLVLAALLVWAAAPV